MALKSRGALSRCLPRLCAADGAIEASTAAGNAVPAPQPCGRRLAPHLRASAPPLAQGQRRGRASRPQARLRGLWGSQLLWTVGGQTPCSPWPLPWTRQWTGVSSGDTGSTATALPGHSLVAGCTSSHCWRWKRRCGPAARVWAALSSPCLPAQSPSPAGPQWPSTAASSSTSCRGTRSRRITWRCAQTSWP